MRKLATIEEVQSLEPIPDADRIELAKIRGWHVVVQKMPWKVTKTSLRHNIKIL